MRAKYVVLTLWCREMDDVAVALEHVDLLDSLDGLYIKLLERGLKLLVVGAGALVDLLHLSAWSTLASVTLSQPCLYLHYGTCVLCNAFSNFSS